MEGWLFKKMKIRRSWKRRYFVCFNDHLQYFKQQHGKVRHSID